MNIGLRIGQRIGPTVGPGGGRVSMAGVARDATSNIYLPANASQWSTTLAVAGVSSGGPSSLYLLQEAAGNAADSIGAIALTAAGTLAYRQAITGWTAKGIATTAGVAGTLSSSSAGLPDISTTSCALLVYVLLPSGVATLRSVAQIGGPAFNTIAGAQLSSSPKKMVFQLDPNTTTGAVDNTSVVRMIWITVNRTAGTAALDTDLEELTATLTSTPTGKFYFLGGDNSSSEFPDNTTYLYAARFDGAAAETTKAQRRAVLRTLGWSIPW